MNSSNRAMSDMHIKTIKHIFYENNYTRLIKLCLKIHILYFEQSDDDECIEFKHQ